MKKTIISLMLLTMAATLSAQNPSWAKKAANAVFTLKTFGADGSLLGSSNGFFVGENGEALSSFTPFKGAQRAVVIDAEGKENPVEAIIAANDMYDVAKFQVAVKRPTVLPVANASATQGSTVWLLPYAAKKAPVCIRSTVSNAEDFQGYSYYTLSKSSDEQNVGCPVLNEGGEVIALLQPSAGGEAASSYAVSARFVNDLRTTGLSLNDPAMRSTAIPKALPDTYNDALLALYMATSTMTGTEFSDYVQRFIQKFPNASDGYIYRARLSADNGNFAAADEDMKKAVKTADNKDDAHYQYAQLIYQKELYQSDKPYEGWNLDKALEEAKEAYSCNPQPVYRQFQAQIMYAQEKYDEAYVIYDELTKGELRSAETFYAAAQCKLQTGDNKAALALTDSAVNTFTKPYIKTAAPYLRARAELNMACRRYQLAINDMESVVALEPANAELWAEKASYELRVNLFDKALESAQECLRLDPDGSDGYLMSGIAQCIKGDKQLGLQNLNKAKELGNSQAQTFIDKYSK